MKRKTMSFSPMRRSFPFFLLLISVAADTIINSPYSPTDYFLLDCGSSENTTTSSDGRTWRGDYSASKFSSSNGQNASFDSEADRQLTSVEQVPYTTARVFNSQFTYSFPAVSPGPKFVRLYFYPAVYAGIKESDFFFTVTSGVYTLLSNFSASLTVAAATKPQVDSIIVKEFCINVWGNQSTLNITFSPSPGFYGFVNGIELCSMPNNLLMSGDGHQIPMVGKNYLFDIDNYTALETVYRLNVGGSSFGGETDTGMFRNWRDDSFYIYGAASGVICLRSNTDIHYTPATPACIAPTAVYTSCRSMGTVGYINLNYNLTWIFPVDSGFYYLVRLHFCEMEDITRVNERVFDIFLNNQTAQEQADVIAWTGGNGIPMYQDYVVYMTQDLVSGGGKQDLWLALHPNMDSKPYFADAILNGVEIFKLNRSYGSLAGSNPDPVRIQMPALQPQDNYKSTKRLSKIMIIGAAALLFGLVALLYVVYFFILRQRSRVWCWVSGEATLMSLKSQGRCSLPKELCRRFAFSDLREATNDFDDVLVIGRGGFGDVYKGYIDGGDVIVAIKRLKSKSKQGAHEFLTEIEMLSQLRHRHLVSLIGYCQEEGEMILVYDYMHHGTLRDHLYGGGGDNDRHDLPWKQRLEICIGAARGLDYLHAGARQPIIHRDIKSTNILLDHKWVAKVADFGLSKMGPTDDPVVTTMVKGTFGYMDPEYYKRMKLTQKSDVYSFGVVLLEVICGRAAVDRRLEYEQMNLANWARGCIEKGSLNEIIDPLLAGQVANDCMEKFVETAYDCLHDQGIQRPTMADVIARLEFALKLQDSVDSTAEALTLTLQY